MARFRFRLQKLLDVRAWQERLAQREFAAAQGEANRVRLELEHAESELVAFREEAAVSHVGVRQLADAVSEGLDVQRRRLTVDLAKAQQDADRCRVLYEQRRRDHKTLARLRDKRFEAWRLESLRAEQQELDELSRLAKAAAGGET